MTNLEVNGRKIGVGKRVYIIAEMSANHNQDLDNAIRILNAAKEAGADAVKLQTYTPDTLTLNCRNHYFRIRDTLWHDRFLYDLYSEACTPWEWQPKLKEIADDVGLDLFSTPFDSSAVDFLESIDVPAYKIASFENVDLPLLRKVARTGKPIIVSTGMATLAEVDEAVQTLRRAGCQQLCLLKCTSSYPADPKEINLRTIPHLSEAFRVPVGLSDHTVGIAVPVAAVSLGACVIEKHFTLSRSDGGPDSAFSLEPHEFEALVKAVRVAEDALGEVRYGVTEEEKKSRVFRRSLFAADSIKSGEAFTADNLRSVRPGHGLHPRFMDAIIGRRARQDIEFGTPLDWAMVSDE